MGIFVTSFEDCIVWPNLSTGSVIQTVWLAVYDVDMCCCVSQKAVTFWYQSMLSLLYVGWMLSANILLLKGEWATTSQLFQGPFSAHSVVDCKILLDCIGNFSEEVFHVLRVKKELLQQSACGLLWHQGNLKLTCCKRWWKGTYTSH